MKIEVKSVHKDGGSCNFCKRGILNSRQGLTYPYDRIYELSNGKESGLKAVICDDCLKELNREVKSFKSSNKVVNFSN